MTSWRQIFNWTNLAVANWSRPALQFQTAVMNIGFTLGPSLSPTILVNKRFASANCQLKSSNQKGFWMTGLIANAFSEVHAWAEPPHCTIIKLAMRCDQNKASRWRQQLWNCQLSIEISKQLIPRTGLLELGILTWKWPRTKAATWTMQQHPQQTLSTAPSHLKTATCKKYVTCFWKNNMIWYDMIWLNIIWYNYIDIYLW